MFLAEIKSAMEAYLERRGDPKVRSLFDVMLFDLQNRERELRIFGQEWFEKAQVKLGTQSPGIARRARHVSRSPATNCSTERSRSTGSTRSSLEPAGFRG